MTLLRPSLVTSRRIAVLRVLALTSIWCASACGGGSSVPAATEPVRSSAAVDRTVSGWVPTATTEVPAIVVLTPRDSDRTPPPDRVPAMDQVARTFLPPLMVVRTGYPAEFHNSDTELHNVNVKDAKTREQAFNVAIGTDDKYVFTFQRDGVYDVSCDVHAGMSAQIVAAATPYVTLADREGRFTFPKVASGSYELTVYAGANTIERTLEIGATHGEVDLR